MENRCVICGEIIPEGRQVCFACEKVPEKDAETLKLLADAYGYKLVRKKKYEPFSKCICGSNRRETWYNYCDGTVILQCKKCGLEATGKTKEEAKRNWNKMVKEKSK